MNPADLGRFDRSSFSPLSPISPQSPFSPTSDGDESIASSSASRSLTIPDHWREETESCIANRALDADSRNDIVRTLVTLLVSKYGPKPGSANVQKAAQQLILKYPFMADDLGSGYVSL